MCQEFTKVNRILSMRGNLFIDMTLYALNYLHLTRP